MHAQFNVAIENKMSKQYKILSLGTYVPQNILSNKDLEEMMETTDEWIVSRTGIENRHILGNLENASDAGFIAAQNAIAEAKIDLSEITHLLVGTCTPDYLSPSVSSIIANKLELSTYSGVSTISPHSKSITCFDFNAACSGFIYGLDLARAFLSLYEDATILLVVTEAMSRRMNYKDRTTSILFGDGAGAVIISAKSNKKHLFTIDDVSLGADGNYSSLITIGGGTNKSVQIGDQITEDYFLSMQGREVFKHAVRGMALESVKLLTRNNLEVADIDYLVAHQANARILNAVAERLEIPPEKVYINLKNYGNTSAASIALALNDARNEGKIHANKKILLTAFGAGLTWGSALISS